MAEPTFEEVMVALRNADKAGNVEDARKLASIAQRLQTQKPEATKEKGMLDKAGEFLSGVAEKGGIIDLKKILSPETLTTDVSKAIGAPIISDFKRDESKAGKETLGSVAARVGKRAGEAGLGAAAYSPMLGVGGILPAMGAGAIQGIVESGAAQLGYSPQVQEAAGVALPSLAGAGAQKLPNIKGLIDNFLFTGSAKSQEVTASPEAIHQSLQGDITSKITSKLAEKAVMKGLGLPSWLPSVVRGPVESFMERRPIDVSPIARELGAKPQTIGQGGDVFAAQEKRLLQQEFPEVSAKTRISKGLYENAASAHDQAAMSGEFTQSKQYQELVKGKPALKTKFDTLFKNPKGEDLVGEDIIKNLRYQEPSTMISEKNLMDARRYYNDWLKEKGFSKTVGGKEFGPEETARGVYEIERNARAKDILPDLFAKGKASAINKELWNLSKDKESKQLFNDELTYFMSQAPAQKSKDLWGDIGKNVKESMGIDDTTYNRITRAINQAKTKQEVSRAIRMYRSAATKAVTLKAEEEADEMKKQRRK